MKCKVLTLFPEMVRDGLTTSIIGRAVENNFIELETVNIRDYTEDRHGKVDDYTYGGGAGMLMQAQPVYDAWRAVVEERTCSEANDSVCSEVSNGTDQDCRLKRPRTIYVTPQGRLFTQDYAAELAQEEELIFLCGHYEGIDQRVLDEVVTDYISIGDYVLTGGELAAMVMIDVIARLVPGVLHNEESAETESFHRHLLEYPQYSRPEEWMGKRVPEVLLSGDHRKIAAWRLERSVELTRDRRPELYARFAEQEHLIGKMTKNKRLCIHMMESLRRGLGEILYADENTVCIYDRHCKLGMLHAFTADEASMQQALTALSDAALRQALCTDPVWLDQIRREAETLHLICEAPVQYRQACYTQNNPLRVRHKDIRPLTEEHRAWVIAHGTGERPAYLAERLASGALYGAFLEERPVGMAGWHTDGSLGFLYVEEAFRRRRIGASLEAFCINRQLEAGYVPYMRVPAMDEPMSHMQEQLGLYLSEPSVWLFESDYNTCAADETTV